MTALDQDTIDIVWESLSDAVSRNDGRETDTDTARYLMEALAERGMLVVPMVPDTGPVVVTPCAGYVVVASMKVDGIFKPIRTAPIYEFHRTLNDAADAYTGYQDGEYRDIAEVGIFPADERGLPINKPLDPHTLTKLVKETRSA